MRILGRVRWRSNAELDEELRTHLDMEIQANRDRGLCREEARVTAQRKFGNVVLI